MLGLHCWEGFSLVAVSRVSSLGAVRGHLLFWAIGSRTCGLQESWHMGLVASQHAGSSRTRDHTCVSCIGRWILYLRATRDALCTSPLSIRLSWTFRLLARLGYCQHCYNEHWAACTLLDHVFLQICPRNGIAMPIFSCLR